MSTDQPPPKMFLHPDQGMRLVLVGAVMVLIGCLFGLMTLLLASLPLLVPPGAVPQGQAMSPQSLIPAMVFYLAFAVGFIALGGGLIFGRRWAWKLTVVLSWMWLLIGVIALGGFMLVVAPEMLPAMAQGNVPREVVMIMQVFMGLVVGCMYVVLPGGCLALLHHESVWVTCLRRDPKVRWTDRCPMPVLALSIILVFWIASFAQLVAYRCVVPVFGVLISGAKGAVVIALSVLALASLAWGTYRLQMAAWWGTLLLVAVGIASGVFTFSRIDLMEMYEKMGMPADTLDQMRKMHIGELMSQWGPWTMLAAGALGLGYLLYVRRYFLPKERSDSDTV
jgi:hypothetical protein